MNYNEHQLYLSQIEEATTAVASFIDTVPDIAIILGSGLGPLATQIENPKRLKYEDIPHFSKSTVAGHAGELIFGQLSGKNVLVMNGRMHYYEGNSSSKITLPIRVFKKLGINNLIVTNAAGGIKDDFVPGDLMLINDHISLFCQSPLIGQNLNDFGTRFPDMSDIYSSELRTLAHKCSDELSITLKDGVYTYLSGPQYETPAEIRAIKLLGGDAVGMSTVPECIVANHCQMNILGISVITNKAAGLAKTTFNHEEVLQTTKEIEQKMIMLVKQIIKEWK